MKRVLITGIRGFVGRNLVESLGDSFSITGIDLADGLDLTDPAIFHRIEGSFDAVIHLAGLSFVPDSYDRPFQFHRVNFNAALNVAEFCRHRSVPKLIYPNTYVYGQPQRLPVDETHPVALPSPYHKSKQLAEDLLLGYFGPTQTQVVALRVFNLYGPYQGDRFLIPQLLKEARSIGQVTVRDLEPRRDFLHIKDFAQLVRLILETDAAVSGVYNVGTGQSHSVAELVAMLEELLSRPLHVRNLNERRPNEIMECYADITKARRVFGWNPELTLEAGLRDLIHSSDHV